MEGRMKSCWSLRLLLLFSLLGLTEHFELRDDEWEELRPDVAALHRLSGLADNMFHERVLQNRSGPRNRSFHGGRVQRSIRRTVFDQNPMVLQNHLRECDEGFESCVIKMRPDFENFLEAIDEHKIQDRLISASEISHSYSRKLLVMTDNEELTRDRVQQEHGMDPHYSQIVSEDCLNDASCLPEADSYTVVKIFGRVSEDGQTLSGLSGSSLAELMLKPSLEAAPVFSLDGNMTTNFHYSFIRIFMIRGVKAVLELNQENHRVYQVMNEPDSVSNYRTPKRPVDHSTKYDHQQILILQNDAIVKRAATYLYDKHPTSSSVYVLDNNRNPQLIHGDSVPLTEGSRLVLVGHGVRESSGEMKLAGFSAKEVVEIVKETFRVGDQIKTTSVVACDVGSDKVFVETLLKELHETANIKTELHLRDAVLQVRHTGEKITQGFSTDGAQWRHKDDSTKVVANLDLNGNVVIRNEPGNRGEPVFTDERNILYINEQIGNRFKTFQASWPTKPQTFIDQNVIEKINKKALNELEALSWGFFHEDLPVPKKVVVSNLQPNEYIIGKHSEDAKHIAWISDNNQKEEILSKCYEVNSGEDVRNVIRHYAKTGENEQSYLMVKDWIYVIDPQTLYVYPVGKRLNNNQNDIQQKTAIMNVIEAQIGNEHYPKISANIIDQNNIVQSKINYVEYVRAILSGDHTINLPLATEAWSTTYFTATVISESARNFRTFPLTLMALEVIESKGKAVTLNELDFFFKNHPMARGQSWIDPSRRGFRGSATATDSSKLNNFKKSYTAGELTAHLEEVLKAEVKQYELWHNLNKDDVLPRLLKTAEKYKIVKSNEQQTIINDHQSFIEEIQKMSEPQASGSLGGYNDGHITSQNLISATKLENSFKLESEYSRLNSLFTEQIHNQMKAKYGEKLAGLHVQEGSTRVENGEFICNLVPEVGEPTEFRARLSPETKTYNEKMLNSIESSVKDLETHASGSTHQVSKFVEHTGTAIGVIGLMLGMKGAVTAFERGDIKGGVVGSVQTTHAVAAMTSAAIATKALSAESRMAKAAATIMRSPAMKSAMIVIPVVGIGFGLYNIVEDFKRGDALGYIDAAFDISMVALDILTIAQPELAPITVPLTMALSVIRMIVDDVYMSIENELNSLPEDAGILEKLLAGLRGFGKGLLHFVIRVASFFYDWRYEEIEEGKRIVAQISDYHKYYKVIKQEDGTSAIDFTSGDASWNGGGINFCLADQGQSELCMDYFVSADERMSKKCWDIDTQGSPDIILGLGESHGLEYTSYEKKVLMFIPAGSVSVVSGYKAVSNSRYGIYKGNSHSNRFFAIQKAEDQHVIEVMLSYYYTLYGEPGDDIFFLGPQKSYVQGSGGKDTYIIPKNGGKTIINNYDDSKAQDTLHFSADYSQISVSKSGQDVVLMYEGSHTVTIQSWFLGEGYRHMNMMSGDGVIFEISPTVVTSVQLVARGINMGFMTQGGTADTSQPLLKTVTYIYGSPHDDALIGNGEKNLMDGGGGVDRLVGGEGEDIYMVKGRQRSSVSIENYSRDQETDLVIIEANLHSFGVRVQGDDLILNAFHDNTAIPVTLVKWFRSPADRHLLVVTKDFITFIVSDKKADCQQRDPFTKCIKSLRIDYSGSSSRLEVDLEEDESLRGVTEVRGSDFDDFIKGNNEHNVFYPGKGRDYMQGRGGEDWYVVRPDQGVKIINNLSPDLKMDFLFLKEEYQHISCTCEGETIEVLVKGRISVYLHHWFLSKKYQHLQIKTSDGVTAGLITNIKDCSSSVMLPLIIDYRSQEPQPLNPPITPSLPDNFRIIGDKICFVESEEIRFCTTINQLKNIDHLNKAPDTHCFTYKNKNSEERVFCNYKGKVMKADAASIKEMYGSSGFDIMVANSNDNVLDPSGDALMFGGEGKDTYIVKHGYGRVMIDNFAEDLNPDTVLVDMDFLYDSQITLNTLDQDLDVDITTKGGGLHVSLINYVKDNQHQHLQFLCSDGVNFKLKSLNTTVPSFEIEAFKVTLDQPQGDCRLDLKAQKNLSEVHTVQGCPQLSNNLLGNARDNVLIGGWLNDALEGDEGDDTLIGGNGDDILVGDFGDDTLYGDDGKDTMLGNSGQDVFIPGPGADLMDGGPGTDTVVYRGDPDTGKGVYVNLLTGQGRYADAEGDVLKDVEMVIGTIYSDILLSGYESSLLQGSDGDDILVSTGSDHLVGGDGHDIYMLAFSKGSVTINNCAKDMVIDVLYLNLQSRPTCEYQPSPDRLRLILLGEDQTSLDIELLGWTGDDGECGHLKVVSRDGGLDVSVGWLLNICQKKASK